MSSLLVGLIDRRLRLSDVFCGRAALDDLELGFVALQALARRGHVGLGGLDLRVEVAIPGRRQIGLCGLQIFLGLDEATQRLLLLRLELRPRGGNTAIPERIEPQLRALHLSLRLFDGGRELGLRGGTATAAQQVELALSGFDTRVGRLEAPRGRTRAPTRRPRRCAW